MTILSRDLIIIGNQKVHKKVIIDKELGKNTKFFISCNDIDVVIASFVSPNGQIFTSSDPFYQKDSQLKQIRLSIPNSEVGHWEVIFERDVRHDRKIILALTVTSEPKDHKFQPIRVNCYFGKLQVRYPATALIYAEVRKGQNAVIGAKVVATVERPQSGQVEVRTKQISFCCSSGPLGRTIRRRRRLRCLGQRWGLYDRIHPV